MKLVCHRLFFAILFKLFIRMFGFGGFVDLQLNYCQQVDGYYEK
jgi:hypothetical protein